MAWWQRVKAFFGVPATRTFDSAPRPIDQIILEMLGGGSNPRASRTDALSIPAVQKGRNMVCSISTLPLVQYGPKGDVVRSPFLEQIDPDVSNVVTLAQTLEDLLFEGISWWRVTAFGWDLFPANARHLDFSSVSVDPPTDRTPAPLPSGIDPREGVVWVDGKPVGGKEIIRFDSPNPAMLAVGGRAIRRALLLDKMAALYSDGGRPLDYFSPAEGADPANDDDVAKILADWKAARKLRTTAYVPAALRYNSVDSPSPADLQLVQLQKQAGLDLANALGVDPEELGISTTSRTYANAVDRRRDRVNDTLAPFMKAITERLSMGDVTKRGYTVAFDLDDYMRANPTERWSVYQTAKGLGAMTVDEIRAEERMPPLPPSAKPAPPPEPPPVPDADPVEPESDAVDASRLPAHTFASAGPWKKPHAVAPVRMRLDADQPLQFADLPVTQFRVDRQRRIVEGLALPYGRVGAKYGLKFRFIKGALRWTSVNRVKLLRDHRMDQPIGVAANLTDTSAGLRVRFKVAKGPAGDEALSLAEDGVLDGMSVGVEFDASVDAEMDPNDDGVMLVRRADLREVSLTAMPAFDDARVTKVAASRTEGNTMEECATCGQRHAPGVACSASPPAADPPAPQPAGLTLSNDQLTALLSRPGAIQALVQAQQAAQQPAQAAPAGGLTLSAEQVDALIQSGRFATLLGMPQVTPAPRASEPEPEQRQTVDPTRRTGALKASVSEPLPYRFDAEGNLTRGATYDFSTDLVSGSQGDGEAMERANAFLRAMGHAFTSGARSAEFAVQTGDVTALNPNRQRPDMYVDQREFAYPIWDAINKGTLTDVTPFVLPKFNTATGLVAAHTQGTEPTPGALTATSQTITPSPVSGKVEVTREAWDQGGNPQLSGIIWRQMQRAWFESLEASAVAMLDALTPTGITLTTGAANATLVGELEAALAALQYVRGGFRMRDFFLQIDLYKKLVDAVDADGRKLLPRLGPSNASGQVSDFYADLDVGGLRGRPGWALAATGSVAASSYLFDRNDVHGWASLPQRLQFEYRVAFVDVGVWGYKATANTDITGVREVIYDPVV